MPTGKQVNYGWFVYTQLNLVSFWWYGDPGSIYEVWQTSDWINWSKISYLQANSPKEYMSIGFPFDQAGKFLTIVETPAAK